MLTFIACQSIMFKSMAMQLFVKWKILQNHVK